jgi:uncharacterized damage-inducible protein DinB
MPEDNPTLDTFYENWKVYQDHLKTAIAPLTNEQLALRASPELRTMSEIAAHIIATRIGWFMRFLGEDIAELAPLDEWDMPEAPPRTATELVHGLDASWQILADALARWSSADMQQVISRERNGQTRRFPRSWVIWHLIEHDLHHGGELSLTLGVQGLQAPDI